MARNGAEKFMITVMVLSLIFMAVSVETQKCDFTLESQHNSNSPSYCSAKSDRSITWQSSGQADNHFCLTVTSSSESKGVTLQDSTQRQFVSEASERVLGEVARKSKEIEKLRGVIWYVLQHLTKEVDFLEQIPDTHVKNILAERNQLKDEVARKDVEIDKFKSTIQLVLQHLSKVPEEIAHVPANHEQKQPTPTPDREESSSDLTQDNRNPVTNDNPTAGANKAGKRKDRSGSSSDLRRDSKRLKADEGRSDPQENKQGWSAAEKTSIKYGAL